jgi:hypothetical protein
MCEPTIVTLAAPVVAPFTLITELGPTAVIESVDVNVPRRTVVVAIKPTVRSTPAAALLATELSLTQTVLTHVVAPSRLTTDHRAAAALVPTTVTVVDPVEATFIATTVLDSTDANVNVDVVLDNA